MSGQNVTVRGDIQTTSGTATVTATTGTAALQGITAGSDVTVLGPTGVTATNPIQSNNGLVQIISTNGPVAVDDLTAMTTIDVLAAGTASSGTLLAGGDITMAGTSVTVDGDATSTNGQVLMNPSATSLTITGTTTAQSIDFQVPTDARVGPLTATAGAVEITAGGLIDLNGDITTNGSQPTTITANGGALTMADGTLLDADSGNVELTASGDVALSRVRTTGPVVTVASSGGGIVDNLTGEGPNIVAIAGALTLNAATGVGGLGDLDIDTTVATVRAMSSGAGDIGVHDTDGLDVQLAMAADGSVSMTSQNGDMNVSGPVTADDAGADEDHDAFLNAGGDMAINAPVTADRTVVAMAYDNMTVANMVGGSGRIELRADWDFDSGTFDSGAGVGVGALTQAGGVIGTGTEELVAVAADGISLMGAGTSVTALQAINGDPANAAAASGNIAVINGGAGGELALNNLDPALPYAIRNFAADGTVTINVDAALTANHRVLSQDAISLVSALSFTQNDSGVAADGMATYEPNAPIHILSGDDIGVYAAATIPTYYSIAAHGAGSDIQLDAANDVNVSQGGVDAAVYAGGALTFTANRDINVGDLASGSSGHLRTGAGDLELDAGSNVNVSGNTQVTVDGAWNFIGDADSGAFTMAPNTLINADTGTAALSADADVTLGSVMTTNSTGDAVRITSRDGGIYGTAPQVDIIADSPGAVTTLTAEQHIGTVAQPVTSTIDILDAYTENGHIYLQETNGLALRDVQAGTNAVAPGNGDITIRTLTGDVLAGYVFAAQDVVNITADVGAIDEYGQDALPPNDVADVIGATLNLVAGDHIGQKAAVLEIDASTEANATSGGALGQDIVMTDTIDDLPVGTIDAGLADVVLIADDSQDGGGAAAITDAVDGNVDITAADMNLTANTGIGSGSIGEATDLDVNVETLTARVLGVGPISIDEVDTAIITLARTADGNVDIRGGFAGGTGSLLVELVDADQSPGDDVVLQAWDDILDNNNDLATNVFSSGDTTLSVAVGNIAVPDNPLEVVVGEQVLLEALDPQPRDDNFWAVLTGLAGGDETPDFVEYIGVGHEPPAYVFWNGDIIGGREAQLREFLMQKTEGYRMGHPLVHTPTAFLQLAFQPAEMAVGSYRHGAVPLLSFRSAASTLSGMGRGTETINVPGVGEAPFVWNFRAPRPAPEQLGAAPPVPDADEATMFWRNIAEFLQPSPKNEAPSDIAWDGLELQAAVAGTKRTAENREEASNTGARGKTNIRSRLLLNFGRSAPGEPQ
ncbi:MAG: hypothetical protein HON70_30945 [Lentisphaerae bacterium]|nr:hypothetical protein [Lentisphaerota bacterium]